MTDRQIGKKKPGRREISSLRRGPGKRSVESLASEMVDVGEACGGDVLSEEKRIDAAVLESGEVEKKFSEKIRLVQILLDNMPCVAILIRPVAREIVALNEAAIKAGAICGGLCYETWGRSDTPCTFCHACEAWEHGEDQQIELELGGTWWDVRWVPISEDLYLHYAFDITERKLSDETLRKQQYYLEKAQEIGKIGSWELDIAKNELVWTDETYRIFGISAGTELTYEVFLNCVHPDDREYVDREWSAAMNGKAYDIEHRVIVDGEVRWVREKAELDFDEEGKCIRGVGFTQDVTFRKEAEYERAALLHDMGERVKELGCLYGMSRLVESSDSLEEIVQGTVDLIPVSWQYPESTCARIVVNESIFETENFAQTEWVQGTAIEIGGDRIGSVEVYYLDEKPESDEGAFLKEERNLINAIAERLGRVVERLQSREKLEEYRDHLEMLVEKRTVELERSNRQLEEEISERRAMELQQKEQLALLSHMSRLTTAGELASSLAHELNQPLCSIATLAEGCKRFMSAGDDGRAEVVGGIEKISRQAERAGKIIRRMSEFVTKHEEHYLPVDVNKVICASIGLLESEAKKAGVTVEFEGKGGRWTVMGDAIQIEQVLLNLLRNGIESMAEVESNRRRLCIGVSVLDEGFVEISVIDKGIGVCEGDIERVFEPFYTTKPSGMGIGLSISRSIIESHGGRLWAKSVENFGTTFMLILPIE